MESWKERSIKRRDFRSSRDDPEVPKRVGKRKRCKKPWVLECAARADVLFFTEGEWFKVKAYKTEEIALEVKKLKEANRFYKDRFDLRVRNIKNGEAS